MTVGSRHHLSWGRAAGRRAHVMRTGRAPCLRISTCHTPSMGHAAACGRQRNTGIEIRYNVTTFDTYS